MRSDQTDPGRDARDAREMMTSPGDSWNREVARGDTLGDTRGDPDDASRERARLGRAGSPAERIATESWQDIKSRFVDDPASAIAAAEELVRLAVEARIRAVRDEAAAICAADRDVGDDGERSADASSTEALRTRLIRYQAYCERLAGPAPH